METVEFPTEIFPPRILEIIEEADKAKGYPSCYTAGALLAASSTILGKSSKVELKRGTVMKPNLFMALVGEPGTVKSHPIKFALGPLNARDQSTIGKHNEAVRKMSKQERESGEMPIARQMIVKDTTIEALAIVLKGNPNGICVHADELNGWFSSFNCYKGGHGRDVEAWLSLHDGDDLVINRKGSPEVICVPDPSVSVIGGIQPEILKNRFKGALLENGFIDRILFVVNSISRPLLWNDCPTTCEEDWSIITEQLFSESEMTRTYLLSAEAWPLIRKWQNTKEELLSLEHNCHKISSFRKIQVAAVKFSVILHVLWEISAGRKPSLEISKHSVELAIQAAEYFSHTAGIIRDYVTGDDVTENNVKNLLKLLPPQFTTQDAIAAGMAMNRGRSSVFNYLSLAQPSLIVPNGKGAYIKTK